jgi:group II intron reverse transcriptase/maturase
MTKNPFKQMDVIRKVSSEGKRVTDCYRLMYKRELWLKAYAKLYPNPGNLTKGTTDETIDGMSLQKIDEIIQDLEKGKFSFSPVRRVYIPKANGKQRPLGVPNFRDKMVQEVMRIILENIYEPIFSENSHGFRPNRSCHTALLQIKRTWRGLTWCIEGDIKGFFDNIDHKKMIEILEKKIDDKRFILLVHNALKCGIMENWIYHNTYSGTPQGGIISPLLANIYLHEFDIFIEEHIKQFDIGKVRERNPEYRQISYHISKLNKTVQEMDKRMGLNWEGRDGHIKAIKKLKAELLKTHSINPMDNSYRRMKYIRYADDFVIGIAGTKEEANQIKEIIGEFLSKNLKLELSKEKTLITHLDKNVNFLGYQFHRWNREKILRVQYTNQKHPIKKRTLSGEIRLEIPKKKLVQFVNKNQYGNLDSFKITHRTVLINNSEMEILYTFNTELRGIAQYYKLANNYHMLDKVFHLARGSFVKTLANKRRTTSQKMYKQLGKINQGELTIVAKNGKPHQLVRLKCCSSARMRQFPPS